MNTIQAPHDLYGYFDYCVREVLNTCFGRMIYLTTMHPSNSVSLDTKITLELKEFEKLPFTDNPGL
jgi:hypothetical protein